MFRSLHNSCLNQSLGHKSDAISTTNLVGHFDPALGVEVGGEITMLGWLNQIENCPQDSSGASCINLTRKNDIQGCHADIVTQCNDALKHFLFDGVDEFISGEVYNEYATSQVEYILTSSWSITSWVKGLSSNFVHILLSENTRDAYISLEQSSGVNTFKCRYNLSSTPVTGTITIPSSIDISKWNQITITQSSNSATFYINGNYIGSLDCGVSYSTYYILIGRYNYSSSTDYTDSGVKLGHVLIYSEVITNYIDRQNFNALHQIKSNRIYGGTYDG